jgi:uncharacterized membrane protein YgcG
MSSLSGKQALDQIDDTLGKARGHLASVDAEFGDARSRLATLRQKQIGLFARLAKLRLVAIEQGGLVDALNDADRLAGRVLDERKDAQAKLEKTIADAESALAADEKRRGAQQTEVAAASEAVDAAEAKAQEALAADDAYQTQLKRTEQADFVADQAEAKAAAARSDRVEKGEPYEADPLFSYLWDRGYGTSAYRAWPLVRWLDGKVAKLCNFEAARRNYALLTEIPARLGEHATSMRETFDHEAGALVALEEKAAAAAEVPKFTTRLESAENALGEIDASIAKQEDSIRGLVAERKAYAAGEDEYYRRSIDTLSQAMQRESFELLRARAARTGDPEDDELVRELVALDGEADRIEQNLAEFRRLHERQNDRVQQLEDVRRQFKARRYDDPLSEFLDGALFALVLRQFLAGAVGSADVWKTIKRQQRSRRLHADPNFGTLRFPKAPKGGPWRMPPGGFGHHGGGFRSGGFRTGGGFRGGGFKTGGGF